MSSHKSNRSAYWDNLKAILIFLVVLGHLLYHGKNDSGRIVDAVLYFIYMFHMPAFVFVSGYFSKRYVQKGAFDARKLIGFLVLYVSLYISLWVFKIILDRDLSIPFIFSTYDVQWYLICMFMWYLTMPLLSKIKPLPLFLISILSGLIVGMDSNAGSFLAMSRFFVFLPFFLAGYYYKKSWYSYFYPRMKIMSYLVFLATLIGTYFLVDKITPYWSSILCGNRSYETPFDGLIPRSIWYVIAFILITSLLCITPKNKVLFTYIGQRTLTVYMLHRFVLSIIVKVGLYSYLGLSYRLVLLCIPLALTITVILSDKHLTSFFNKAFSIDYGFLLKQM